MGVQPKRYHFRVRMMLGLALAVWLLVLNAEDYGAFWLIALDAAAFAAVVWVAWCERVPLGIYLRWRSTMIGAGLGVDAVRNGKPRTAVPSLRRLYVGPDVLVLHIAPFAGRLAAVEDRLPRITALLGMSAGHVLDQRAGLLGSRLVVEFRRASQAARVQEVGRPPVWATPTDGQRGAAVVRRRDGVSVALPPAPRPLVGTSAPVYAQRQVQGHLYDWATVQRAEGPQNVHVLHDQPDVLHGDGVGLVPPVTCPPVLAVDAAGNEAMVDGCPLLGLSRAARFRTVALSGGRVRRCAGCRAGQAAA